MKHPCCPVVWMCLLLLLLEGGVSPTHGLATNAPRSHTVRNSPQQQTQQGSSTLCIRRTTEQDLSIVSKFLASSSAIQVSSSKQQKQQRRHSWKDRIHRLFAQADIHKLLSERHRALVEGRKRYHHLMKQLEQSEDSSMINGNDDDSAKLAYFWQNAPTLQALIRKASTSTAEDNVWRNRTMEYTPTRRELQHVQLTAVYNTDNEPVGFCEVAMLQNKEQCRYYTPAILNLAVAPQHRRCGVATRLLTVAERYVQMHWETDNDDSTMGLYVHADNVAAQQLYQSLGYERSSSNNDDDDQFWYLTKPLVARRQTVLLR